MLILTRIKEKGEERGACSFYDTATICPVNVKRNKNVYKFMIFKRLVITRGDAINLIEISYKLELYLIRFT